MKIEAKKVDGVIEAAYEVILECAACGMEVDAVEYEAGTCSDCGAPWDEVRHTAIHVTSVPMSGQTMQNNANHKGQKMASTYSALKIELIGTGEQSGTWGVTTNTNLGTALEEAIVGRATANFTTDADLTISLTNTNATQTARNYILNVTSGVSLSTTRNLIVPTINKPYIVENNTTGGQSITVKTSGGTGITIPNGKKAMVYADGTNVVSAFSYVPDITTPSATITGGSISNATVSTANLTATGGVINGTIIGNSTAAAATVTTLNATVITATGDSSFTSTGALQIPVGTTAQQPAGANGKIRYNSTTGKYEGYSSTTWSSLGGGATGGGTDEIFVQNGQTVTTTYAIPSGKNAMSTGPITINNGITVTVPSGSRWVVLQEI